jgi:AmmeMemoRadiSam system protein A
MEEKLTKKEQEALLRLARETIKEFLKNGKRKRFENENPKLNQPGGVFVTIKIDNNLRGCIGYITSPRPLYQTVIEAAIAAAVNDPRFTPLTIPELAKAKLEISVLTPPREITNIEEIEVGKHGLIITKGFNKGLLLPQVASEEGWDRLTFLKYTCLKAGLLPDAWDKDAKIEIFSAQVFRETK